MKYLSLAFLLLSGLALQLKGNSFEEEMLAAENLSGRQKIDKINSAILKAGSWNYVAWAEAAEDNLKAARRLKYEKGLIDSKISLLKFYVHKRQDDSAFSLYKEITNLGGENEYLRGLGLAHFYMGMLYEFNNNNSQALDFYKTSEKLLREAGDYKFYASSLARIGLSYASTATEYKKAAGYIKKALKVYELNSDTAGIVDCYLIMAYLLDGLERYSSVNLNNKDVGINIEKASKLAKKSKDSIKLAVVYFYKNILAQRKGDSSAMMSNLFKALELVSNKKSLPMEAEYLGAIGWSFQILGHYDSSDFYLDKSLDIYRQIGNSKKAADILLYKLDNRIALGQYGKSLGLADSIYKFNLSSKDYYSSIEALQRKAEILAGLSKYNEARDVLQKALEIGDENNMLALNNLTYSYIIQTYESEGDYQNANRYINKLLLLKDSLNVKEKIRETAGIQTRFEMENTLREEKRRKEEEAKALAAKIERRNMIQYSGIFLFLILIFVLTITQAKKNLSYGFINAAIFISFLLLFEFILVVSDPFVDSVTNSEPVYKLLMNFGAALIIVPFHNYGEKKLMNRFRHLKGDEK